MDLKTRSLKFRAICSDFPIVEKSLANVFRPTGRWACCSR